jgi:hypothetical protein
MKIDLHYGTGIVSLRVPERTFRDHPALAGEQTSSDGGLPQTAGHAGAFLDDFAANACVLDDGRATSPGVRRACAARGRPRRNS